SDERICRTFHVPGYKVGVGPLPPYQSATMLDQVYYDNCLQTLLVGIESTLGEGLGLPNADRMYRLRLDLDALLRMDEGGLTDVLVKQRTAGIAKIDELRKRLNLPPVPGGDVVFLQEQDHSIEALAKRDAGPDPF